MIRNRWIALIGVLTLLSTAGFASTFVGNGGNAGDVELTVTRKELDEVLGLIQKNQNEPDMKLCECYEKFSNHPSCSLLRKLTRDQVRFCADFLKTNARNYQENLRSLQFHWTSDSIEVQEQNQLRAADAVMDRQSRKLTLRQSRFVEMPAHERLFLITHELGHLQTLNGRPIEDVQKAGPFDSADGGRELLNAVAAATVMEALDTEVMVQYQSVLRMSKSQKDRWIEVSLTNHRQNSGTLNISSARGWNLGYRHQLNSEWGLSVEARGTNADDRYLSAIKFKETTTALALKGNYRWFPFENPLTALGQSHFILGLGVEKLTATYNLSDTFIEDRQTASSTAGVADLTYMLPFQGGAWAFVRAGWANHKYSYPLSFRNLDVEIQSYTSLGVSYGF